MRVLRLAAAAATFGLAFGQTCAMADTAAWPVRGGQIIVPYAAGGITDLLARGLAQKISERSGHSFIIVNRPGANSQVGTEAAAKSPADGYTLLVTADTTFTTNPALYPKMKYDLSDFEPVSGLGISPHALVVHPDVPVKNFAELIEFAKKNPQQAFYGTFGSGSSGHLNILNVQKQTGASFTPVHYSGASPAINDLLGGHIKLMTVSIGLIAGPWEAGKLKVLAFGSDKRLEKFPDMPIMAETLRGFEAGSWYALFAPKGTPPAIVEKISTETQRIFNDPAFQSQFLAPSYTYSIARGPKDLAERIRTDSERLRQIIVDAKVTAE